MNEEPDAERITRWTDGQLGDDEIGDLLRNHPGLMEDRESAHAMGDLLREQFPPEVEVPFPDGFNRQVMRRIEEAENNTLEARLQRFFSWFTISDWGLPAAASAALVFLLVAGTHVGRGVDERSRVVHLFAPHPEHTAEADFVPKAEATVIRLDGLEPVEMGGHIAGFFPDRAERNAFADTTTFYAADGKPIAVLAVDAEGEPRLATMR